MNRRRWYRVTNVTVALAVVATLIMLPYLLEASPGTITIRPGAVGDETNLTPYPNTGEANWEDVDEATSDDDEAYVEGGGGAYVTDLYALGDTTVSGKGKINSVTVYINCRGTAEGVGARTRIKTNAVAYDGTEITLTISYATYSTAYTTNPQTTNEWTWAEINALQAGVGLKKPTGGATSRCTQVWVVVDYTPATLESYKEVAHTTVWGTVADPYDTGTQTAYIYGPNFIASHGYTVGYYDNDGTKVASESVISGADNTLSSQYLLTTDPNAIAGTWHAVAFDNDLGSPPNTYAECPGAVGYMVEDSFEVNQGAIPEFPTAMAGITVAGLCFGIYYWMRKRRLAYVKA